MRLIAGAVLIAAAAVFQSAQVQARGINFDSATRVAGVAAVVAAVIGVVLLVWGIVEAFTAK